MTLSKTCKNCDMQLPLDSFDYHSSTKDNKYPYCKDCRREMRGHKPRQPPKLAEVDDSLIEQVEAKLTTPTKSRLREKLRARNQAQQSDSYAHIVAEALVYASHPAMQKRRKVRNTAARIAEQPVLDFERVWDEKDEDFADAIFDAWDKRQKQDQERYKEINKRLPIATKKNQKNYEMRQGRSYEILALQEEGFMDKDE